MEKYRGVLESCPLFDGIVPDEIQLLIDCLGARTRAVGKGECIFHEGDPAKDVGILLDGKMQIVRDDYYGNRSIQASLEPGDLFGEAFACAGAPILPVSVVAILPSAVMLVDCRRILTSCPHACAFHAHLVGNLLKTVASKNLILNQKIELLSRRTIRERLMAYLLSEAKKHHASTFTIPFDRQGLADYLGVERSALSAEISRLRNEGILECHRSDFHLLQH